MANIAQVVQLVVEILVLVLKWIGQLFDQVACLLLGKDARKKRRIYRITGPASVNRLKPLLPQLDPRIVWQEATDPEEKVRSTSGAQDIENDTK